MGVSAPPGGPIDSVPSCGHTGAPSDSGCLTQFQKLQSVGQGVMPRVSGLEVPFAAPRRLQGTGWAQQYWWLPVRAKPQPPLTGSLASPSNLTRGLEPPADLKVSRALPEEG